MHRYTAKRLFKSVSRALLLAALVALFMATATATQSAVQAQSDSYVDLIIEVEVGLITSSSPHTAGWVITARNEGTAAAYGVEVDIEFADRERVTEIDIGKGFQPKSGRDCSEDIPAGTTCINGVWTLGRLDAGEEVVLLLQHSLPTGCCTPARAVIKNTVPVEEERLKHNNADVGWMAIHGALTPGGARAAIGNHWLEASVDNPLPGAGDTVSFTFEAGSISSLLVNVAVARVRLKLDDGMGTPTATTLPSGTTFAAAAGLPRTWDWDFDLEEPNYDRTLEVSTTLDDPLPAGVAVSDLCLTAEMTAEAPENLSGRLTSAEICLREHPPVLLQEGQATLFTMYPCVGVTTYPCSNDDTLEMGVIGGTAAVAAGIGHPGAVLRPERVFVQVKDPEGRRMDGYSASVNSGTEPSWHTGRKAHEKIGNRPVDGVTVSYTRREFTSAQIANYNRLVRTVSVAGLDGTAAPGLVKFRYPTSGNAEFTPNPSHTKTDSPFPSVVTSIWDRFVEFSTLGTYKLDFTAAATHTNGVEYSDTGSYIFHVGPVAELEVRDGGRNAEVASTQRAFTIVAVNNGPDAASAARVTVTGLNAGDYVSHSATAGSFNPSTGVWTIGEFRDSGYQQEIGGRDREVLTIITSAAVNARIAAAIENTRDYSVAINGTTHSAKYFDYMSGNNSATIWSRAGTGEGHPDAPTDLRVMETRVGNVLMWQPPEAVNGRRVSHYEVQRWASSWTTVAEDVKGTVYLDMAGRANADYRVRAVNDWGHKGPSSITGRPPGAPGNFTVVLSESGNAAVLSWTAPASPSPITGYVIDISDTDDGDSRTNDVTVGGSVTSWTHTGLSGGDVKFYRVQARNRDGVGAWTAWQSVSAGPGAPGNLRARANGPNEIVLTWSAASSRDVPIYEYELEYSDTSASEGYEWNFLQTVLLDEGLRYVDNTVPDGTTRYYRVRARTLQGNVGGAWSNVASATTSEAGPSAPLNVTVDFVVGNTENAALLTWDAPASGNASYYRIEHSTDGGATWESESARHTATCNVGGTTKFCYTDSGLFSGTEHWYRVAGVNSSGVAGEWSQPVSHVTQGTPTEAPGEPQNLRITSVNGRQVSFAWDEPENDGGSSVTGYEYMVEGACVHDPSYICEVIKPTRTGGKSATVTVPNVRGHYDFSVRALNAVGAGWWTQPVSQYVNPQRNWRVTLSPSRLTVPEGGEATYRVRLTADPGQPVMLALWWDGDPDLGNTLSYQQFKWLLPSNYQNPDIYLDPDWTSPWNVGVPITVTADEDDADSENGTAAIHNTIYYVPCADLDYPAGCVDDPEDTGVNVCLTATERDNDPNPVNSPTVTCQNSSFNSFNMANVRANILADVRATDVGKPYSVTRRASVVEGGSAALTLTLAEAAPAGGVEFTVAANYGQHATATAEDVGAIVSPVTAPEGDATLEIAIPTVDDDLDEDDEMFLVTVIAATPGWLAEPGDDTAMVTVEDDDTAGVTVNADNPLTVREGEGATYTVALDSRPTADVTIEAAVGDDSKVVVSPVSETVTPDNWSLPVTFSVNALSDEDTGDESVAISHGLTSDDPRYAVLQVSAVSVSVTDTTAPGQQRANSAPTVSAAIDDVTIVSESGTRQVSLSGVFADADNDDLSVTASSSDENVAVAGVSADQSTLPLLARARGTATVTVTAADGHGGEVADEFTVKVKAAPVVASAIDDVSELEAGATHDVSLSGVFNDADSDSLTLTAASSDEAVATVAVVADQSSLTVTGVSGGTATITVTAEDADGNTVSDEFDVSVAAQQQETSNQVPTVSAAIADVTIVNESGTEQVSLSGVFSDADGDALTITAASSDESIATVAVASDQSGLTVTAKARGTATVTVTAEDGNGGTVEDAFSVTVKAAPTVASALADVSGMPAETVREVSLSGVFSDADGDRLALTAETSDFEVVEVFVGTPGNEDNLVLLAVAEGSVTITVTAEDADGNTVSDTFDVSVTAEEEPEDGQAGQ